MKPTEEDVKKAEAILACDYCGGSGIYRILGVDGTLSNPEQKRCDKCLGDKTIYPELVNTIATALAEERERVQAECQREHKKKIGDAVEFAVTPLETVLNQERSLREAAERAARYNVGLATKLSEELTVAERALSQIGMLCKPVNKGKVSLEELEKIIQSEQHGKVQTLPNGEVVVSDRPDILEIVNAALKRKEEHE